MTIPRITVLTMIRPPDDPARQDETRLRESEERVRLLLDSTGEAIYGIDLDGLCTFSNPACARLLGYGGPGDLLGKSMHALIHHSRPDGTDYPNHDCRIYRAFRDGEGVHADDEVFWRADGTSFPVEYWSYPIRRQGRLIGSVVTFIDVTERKTAEATIAEQARLARYGRDIGKALTGSTTLEEALARCAEVTVRHLQGAFARIWTVNEAGDVLELRASAGMYTHTDGPHGRVPVGRFKIGLIAQERKPHLTNSVPGDPRVPAQDWVEREGMVAFAGYPLIVEDRLVGVLAMFARQALSVATLEMMASVADEIALGIERKKAEDRLRRQTEWLSVTLASIGDAVIATDVEGRVTFLNPVAQALTGWTPAGAAGSPLGDVFRIVDETTRASVESPAARALREGAVVGLANHTVLIARDGAERAIDDSAAPIRDETGAVVGAVLVFRDVDRKRRAERALEESEERYRTLTEISPQTVWAGDPDGAITYVNAWWVGYTGLTPEQSAGGGWFRAVHPDHRARVKGAWSAALAAGTGYELEVPFRRADGAYRWHLSRGMPLKDDAGRVVKWTGVATDIHDRKHAQDALRLSEDRLRLAIESAGIGTWDFHPDTGETNWDARCKAVYGLPPDAEVSYQTFLNALHPEDRDRAHAAFRKALDPAGGGLDITYRVIGVRDGVERWLASRGRGDFDPAGKAVRVIGTVLDVTDQTRAAEELRRGSLALQAAKEEAEQANRAKDQFLAVLSHELRTPLNPILLAATAMLERPTDPDELRPTLEMIRQNVSLQARLIDDLLDVMRIVRGKMPLHWEVADCHRLIEQAIQICRSEVFGKELRLETSLDAARHHVNADPARLQQVVWNLIKNALKFTPAGGTITVRTRNRPDDGAAPGFIEVEVADTGIGIEPDTLPKVFDPFQQGETTITRKFGGLGLGLAICKGIVEAHGGVLAAESQGKDRGTTFRVVLKALPRTEADAPGDDPDHAPAAPPGPTPPLRILVVEDEPTTLRLMARLLRGLGHSIDTANTIAGALQTYEAGAFDLIVSDIGLPDGSGLELMRRVVAGGGRVPAIALTGYGMEDDIRRSREAGFTAHLTKPIDFTKLEAMIRQVTPARP